VIDALYDLLNRIGDWLLELLLEPYVLIPAGAALVRAMGVTIESGNTGLLFSFGRARAEVPPGFRLLLPFLQVVRIVPTRSRTLDLPEQKVTTFDGLVYEVDANVVFRVADVRKALIEVDDLLKGMRQMLGLSVQEVLRASERNVLRAWAELDRALELAMERRLAPWGVVVERAGFTSIRPSAETLRLTQLGARVGARRRNWSRLREGGVDDALALPLLGPPRPLVRRQRRAAAREAESGRRRRAARIARGVLASSKIKSQDTRRALELRARRGLAARPAAQAAPPSKR
jgi:regulator of protease activity HflC (stomatin/prohibitin superfamily)